MLRRAAPFAKLLKARPLTTAATHQQSGPAVPPATSAASPRRNEHKSKGYNVRHPDQQFTRRERTNQPDEASMLMRRHGEAIENTEVETLHDAVERIEWYGMVSPMTLNQVSKILHKASAEEMTALSDRALGKLLAAYGAKCEALPKKSRKRMVEEVEKAFKEKNIVLGPASRAALFSVRIDNSPVGEVPSVVAEVSSWEEAGLGLTEDILVEMSRAYAMEGDKKGVIELLSHAKSLFDRVDARFVELLAYAIAMGAEGGVGLGAIEKLAALASPEAALRIWGAAALAAARKGDVEGTRSTLSRVPLGAKLYFNEQNVVVVNAVCALIEMRVQGAEEALSSYLSAMNGVLNDKHPSNVTLIARTRSAIEEGEVERAVRFYSMVHESFKNRHLGVKLREAFGLWMQKEDTVPEEVKRTAAMMEKMGVIYGRGFLLTSAEGPLFIDVLTELSTNEDQLTHIASGLGGKRFELAKKVSHTFGPSRVVEALPFIAAVMFVSRPKTAEEMIDVERLMFSLAKNDPSNIEAALTALSTSKMWNADFLSRMLVTSSLAALLVEKDALISGRIDKILDSPSIVAPMIVQLTPVINKLLRYTKGEEEIKTACTMAARVLATGFLSKTENRSYGAEAILAVMSNRETKNEVVEQLVAELAKQPSVGLTRDQMADIKGKLKKRGLENRMDLVDALKAQGQTTKRWLATPIPKLEEELSRYQGMEEPPTAVVFALSTVITNKMVTDKSRDQQHSIGWLERMEEINKAQKHKGEEQGGVTKYQKRSLRMGFEQLHHATMIAAVKASRWEDVERLWKIRTPLYSLPLPASLVLASHAMRNGRVELEKEIIQAIREDGHGVSAFTISEVGELFKSESESTLDEMGKWLQENFRLEAKTIARLQSGRRTAHLEELIRSGNAREALNYAKEQSTKLESAFGQYVLMREAIKIGDKELLQDVIAMVTEKHNQQTAILDLAFCSLMEHRQKEGAKLFGLSHLKISKNKLNFFVHSALEVGRVDVPRAIFKTLATTSNEERISNDDLNWLAMRIGQFYYHTPSAPHNEVAEFGKELKESEITMNAGVKEMAERLSTVESTVRSSAV